ncbi:MAG: ComF family protein [Elusimicrobia bacterium]|nr:ComF family protein [Elusimicrobiota bacterium]
MFGYLLNIFFPVECTVCGGGLGASGNPGICGRCRGRLEIINSFGCRFCGRPVHSGGISCESCRKLKPYIKNFYTACYYTENIKKIIIYFKYKNRKYLKSALAGILRDLYLQKSDGAPDIVVPVPLYRKRRKERGFNQVELLVKEFSESTGIAMGRKDVLERITDTVPQSSLKRKERFSNMQDVFRASEGVKGKRIMIIDDVATTGATVQNAAKALMKAGAVQVDAMVVAHGM